LDDNKEIPYMIVVSAYISDKRIFDDLIQKPLKKSRLQEALELSVHEKTIISTRYTSLFVKDGTIRIVPRLGVKSVLKNN